jgi:hypothetical protein
MKMPFSAEWNNDYGTGVVEGSKPLVIPVLIIV